ncbi:MAG: hypothetical protein V3U16_05690 [Candidatus Neomarinimicrobiota bacterium]
MRTQKQILMILAIITLTSFGIYAQELETIDNQNETGQSLTIVPVEAKYVCMGMGTNRVFSRELIPAVLGDKTYYGCCDGCQATLLKDPNSRVAVDPITGNTVDKATAIIGALPDGIVHYFETEESMQEFAQLIQSKE